MSERNINLYQFPDVCICCGAPVPEGSMVCSECERASVYRLASKTEKDSKKEEKNTKRKPRRCALLKKRNEG